jgi:putative transposase
VAHFDRIGGSLCSGLVAQYAPDYSLKEHSIQISMDGKGRALDNIYIERFWRSLKYEHVYLQPAEDGLALFKGIKGYINFYNQERRHHSLNYHTPAESYIHLAA